MPIPIRKKGYRGEEAYSLIDQKKRPVENRDLCHDHQRTGRMLSTFFSPKTQTASALTLRNQIHRNRRRNRELYTRDSALGGWLPSYLPRTFALTFQRCFRCAGMAVNFFPAEFFPNKLP